MTVIGKRYICDRCKSEVFVRYIGTKLVLFAPVVIERLWHGLPPIIKSIPLYLVKSSVITSPLRTMLLSNYSFATSRSILASSFACFTVR